MRSKLDHQDVVLVAGVSAGSAGRGGRDPRGPAIDIQFVRLRETVLPGRSQGVEHVRGIPDSTPCRVAVL